MDNARAIASSTLRSSSTTNEPRSQKFSASSDAASSANRKRKRSAQGCVVAQNDVIVEELKKIRGKIRESSHLAGNYGRAIASVQHHPEPITSAREAKQLRNIGNYIANQIQAILQKNLINSGTSTTEPTPQTQPSTGTSRPSAMVPVGASAADRRDYVPAQGKQPWYLLRALALENATADSRAVAVKLLLEKMQAIGVRFGSLVQYDGNAAKLRACMAPLVNSHQVIARAMDGGVFLTDRGVRSAALCSHQSAASAFASSTDGSTRDEATSRSSIQTPSQSRVAQPCIELSDSDDGGDVEFEDGALMSQKRGSTRENTSQPDVEPLSSAQPALAVSDLVRPSDEWEIVLLLDHREILSKRNRDILERKLLESRVTCEVRALNVGDVQWIARRYRSDGTYAVDEFMLNVIVERKQVTDLSGSIIDRRYSEQKTRLRDSGMTHVIYLVEGSLSQQTTVRASGLQTALVRTQVQNRFFVQLCQNADESVAFLKGVHMSLLAKLPVSTRCRNGERAECFRPSPVFAPAAATLNDWTCQFCQPIRSYADFNAQFRKKADFRVGEIYQMMLMQVHGLSSARTVALAALHPTFQHLAQAIQRGDTLEGLRYGDSQRRMGAKTHTVLRFLVESSDYEREPPSTGTRSKEE